MASTTNMTRRRVTGSPDGALHQTSLLRYTKSVKKGLISTNLYPRAPSSPIQRQKENVAPLKKRRSSEEAVSSAQKNQKRKERALRNISNDRSLPLRAVVATSNKRKQRDWDETDEESNEERDTFVPKRRCVIWSHANSAHASPTKNNQLPRNESFEMLYPQESTGSPLDSFSPTRLFQPLSKESERGSQPLIPSSQTQGLTPLRPNNDKALIGFPVSSCSTLISPILASNGTHDKEESTIIPSSQPEMQLLGDDIFSPPKPSPKPRPSIKLIRRVPQPLLFPEESTPLHKAEGEDILIRSSATPELLERLQQPVPEQPRRKVQRIRRQGASMSDFDPHRPGAISEHASPLSRKSPSEGSLDSSGKQCDPPELKFPASTSRGSTHGEEAGTDADPEVDAGPFWETQPLILDSSSPALSYFSPRRVAPEDVLQEMISNASTEKDDPVAETGSCSPLQPDPDFTLVNPPCSEVLDSKSPPSSPLVTKLSNRFPDRACSPAKTLIRNSSSFDPKDNDADITMVNPSSERKGETKRFEEAQQDKDIERLDDGGEHAHFKPLREIVTVGWVGSDEEGSPATRIESVPLQRALDRPNGAVADGTPARDPLFDPVLLEDEAMPYMSLPADWQALETRLNKSTGPPQDCDVASSPLTPTGGISLELVSGSSVWDEYGEDDAFGPDLSPRSRTLENGWPEVVKRFEEQPAPYVGMFSGLTEDDNLTGLLGWRYSAGV